MTREANIHSARVYLREARLRASNPVQRNFCFVLLSWAANARRRAMDSGVSGNYLDRESSGE